VVEDSLDVLKSCFVQVVGSFVILQFLVCLVIVEASGQCVRMGSIDGNAARSSVESNTLEVNVMVLQVAMVLDVHLNDRSIYKLFIRIKLGNHFCDGVWLEQEVIGNALSVQDLR
jgi:hypothetical protein